MNPMLDCRQVSRLVSESLDRDLPLWTRMQLWMHLAMCGVCSRFRQLMVRIDRELKEKVANDQPPTNKTATLSAEARQKLKKIIESHE